MPAGARQTDMSASSRHLAARIGPIGLWSSQLLACSPNELADASRELERLGFGAVWLPESTWADPMVGAALILAATERLCVATGVVRIHGRLAPTTSNSWQALSGWFPGRFVLGLGVSHRPSVERLGQSYERPLAQMAAYLDELAACRFDGRKAADDAPVHSVLAAVGPKMMALAGERTDGAHSYTSTAGHTATARSIMGPGPLLAPEVKVVFESDATIARAIAANRCLYDCPTTPTASSAVASIPKTLPRCPTTSSTRWSAGATTTRSLPSSSHISTRVPITWPSSC